MKFPFSVEPATFLRRPNRFLVYVELLATGETVAAHCPDPGRLTELLIPGVRVYVSAATNRSRKSQFDLRFVEHPDHGQLVSLDTRIPNSFVYTLLRQRALAPFAQYTDVQSETVLPITDDGNVKSRIDFCLRNADGAVCWLEVKSVTLVENDQALFPDAPTARGRRHVEELGDMVRLGQRCAVLFLIQRPDAKRFAPNIVTDPGFAGALADASQMGLEVYAYSCTLTLEQIGLARRIPICLS